MKGIRRFQRFMLVLLVAINSFVFMSMHGMAIEWNLLLTAGVMSSVIILTLVASHLFYKKNKKSTENG